MQLWRDTYARLSTCRQVGMVAGPIPWTAVRDWCKDRQMTRSQADFFAAVIEITDAAFLRRSAAGDGGAK